LKNIPSVKELWVRADGMGGLEKSCPGLEILRLDNNYSDGDPFGAL